MQTNDPITRAIDAFQRVIDAIEAQEPLLPEEELELDFLPIAESLIDYDDRATA